jgi:hypothetical protein
MRPENLDLCPVCRKRKKNKLMDSCRFCRQYARLKSNKKQDSGDYSCRDMKSDENRGKCKMYGCEESRASDLLFCDFHLRVQYSQNMAKCHRNHRRGFIREQDLSFDNVFRVIECL